MLYVGLDHSLTAFGLAAVPTGWGTDFRRVRRATLETKPGQAVHRRAALARDVIAWTRWAAERESLPITSVRVFVEGGIFMRGKAETIRSQERLVGVLEHELWACLGIELELVEQTHARGVFMGKSMARGRGAGDAAQALLRTCLPNPGAWDEAELDAFIVANAALCDAGEAFVSVAPEAA